MLIALRCYHQLVINVDVLIEAGLEYKPGLEYRPGFDVIVLTEAGGFYSRKYGNLCSSSL